MTPKEYYKSTRSVSTEKWTLDMALNFAKEYHDSEMGGQQNELTKKMPTEKEILDTIFRCVSIRGINLEDYKYQFENTNSGLYTALVELFSSKQ